MQLAAPHQAPGDVGPLQRRSLSRRMGRKIAGNRNEDVPALVGVAPSRELPDPGLQLRRIPFQCTETPRRVS